MSYSDVWFPSATVTGHNGQPIGRDERFFAAPPIEIGDVLSVNSEIKQGRNPLVIPPGIRAALVFLAVLAGCGGTYLLIKNTPVRDVNDLGALLCPFVLGGAVYWLTGRRKYMTIVGKQGAGRAAYPADVSGFRPTEVLFFRDAAHVRVKETKQYHSGVYGGTEFDFTWTDESRKKLFVLKGRYRASKLFARTSLDYQFAKAAEAAWTDFLREQAHAQWRSGDVVKFPLTRADYVALGPSYIEIVRRGMGDRFAIHEMGSAGVENGIITIRRRDAKPGLLGIGGAGVFTFDYASLANARLFFSLLAELSDTKAAVPV